MSYDVAVVGSGVFGVWTAYTLRREGASVLLIDAYGAGNSRASSGGESRIIRLGYGPDEIYSRLAQRSLVLWQELFGERDQALFQKTGVLWLAREHDSYCESVFTTLRKLSASCDRLDHDQLVERFPQFDFGPTRWGLLEPDSGVLMGRRAVQAVAAKAKSIGVDQLQEAINTPETTKSRIGSVKTSSGKEIAADRFVFACGPWLPKLFPGLLGDLIHVTRQEVIFFGVPPGDEQFSTGALPAWIDFNDLVYGIPNLDGRGFKLAIDAHGPEFDPDLGERVVTATGLTAAREYLGQRMPLLANAPVTESRVCQYENTSNGDFLIDRHPMFENVWVVGGGSGHGFKHGPAVGEYTADMLAGRGTPDPRFSLASKETVRHRQVY
jgi:sarcosine oxidase